MQLPKGFLLLGRCRLTDKAVCIILGLSHVQVEQSKGAPWRREAPETPHAARHPHCARVQLTQVQHWEQTVLPKWYAVLAAQLVPLQLLIPVETGMASLLAHSLQRRLLSRLCHLLSLSSPTFITSSSLTVSVLLCPCSQAGRRCCA